MSQGNAMQVQAQRVEEHAFEFRRLTKCNALCQSASSLNSNSTENEKNTRRRISKFALYWSGGEMSGLPSYCVSLHLCILLFTHYNIVNPVLVAFLNYLHPCSLGHLNNTNANY